MIDILIEAFLFLAVAFVAYRTGQTRAKNRYLVALQDYLRQIEEIKVEIKLIQENAEMSQEEWERLRDKVLHMTDSWAARRAADA